MDEQTRLFLSARTGDRMAHTQAIRLWRALMADGSRQLIEALRAAETGSVPERRTGSVPGTAQRRRMMRRVAGRAILLALALLVAAAGPASAHGIGGTDPTNYETTLTRVEPRVTGVSVEVVDLGNGLRLTNDTDHDVLVLGYEGEPYLRIGPRGVFENRRSPATYLNRSRIPDAAVPRSADPDARPVWRQVSNGRVATWHDHRAHYMGADRPPVVQDDPGRRHVLDRWTVELRDQERTIRVHGLLVWVPPPSPWPYVALAVGVAALVVGLSRTRAWRAVLGVALAALVLCAAGHVFGHWNASTASLGTKLAESIYSIVGIALRRPRARLDVAAGHGGEHSLRPRRRHLPARRRRPRRRVDAGPFPGADIVVAPRGARPGRAHPRARASGSRRPPRSASGQTPPGASRETPRHARWDQPASPVELGAPFVVVRLHLDGRVRDLVPLEEHARLVEHAVRVGARRRPSRARSRRPSPT